MSTLIGRLVRDTRGATAIEYGLITGLIAIAAIGAMVALGDRPIHSFDTSPNGFSARAS